MNEIKPFHLNYISVLGVFLKIEAMKTNLLWQCSAGSKMSDQVCHGLLNFADTDSVLV